MKIDPPADAGAFTQGVGTVFQFVGVTLFLILFSVCCISGVLTRSVDSSSDWSRLGWGQRGREEHPEYSVKTAVMISLPVGILLGLAVAGLGLGLQARKRGAPTAAAFTAIVGAVFWLMQTVFFSHWLRFLGFTIVAGILAIIFIMLSILAVIGMARAPSQAGGSDLLPADYQLPFSHLNQDSPEMRLAAELEVRRRKLAVQQKELEQLENRLKRKLKDKE